MDDYHISKTDNGWALTKQSARWASKTISAEI